MLENRWARDETLNKVTVAGLKGQKTYRANGLQVLLTTSPDASEQKFACLLYLRGQLLLPFTASQ
ncbi:MAG: hypothetical protein RLY14_1879 [Planctomycetota bacterium]|jgi:hypothetical protein